MNREMLRAGVVLLVFLALLEISIGPLMAVGLFEDEEPPVGVRAAVATPTVQQTGATPEGAAEAAGDAGDPVIDASSWDDLSREIIPKVLELSLDSATMLRYVRSASCTIDVLLKISQVAATTNPYFTPPVIPPSSARFNYSIDDADNDGTIAEDEVTVDTTYMSDATMRYTAGRISKGLRALATFNIVNVLPEVTVKTRKTDQGYEVTLTPIKDKRTERRERQGKVDVNPIRLSISNDFRLTSMRTESAEGLDQITTFKHLRAGGKWLLSEFVTSSAGESAFAATDKCVNSYRMEGGLPLLATTIIDSSTPTSVGMLRTHQEYTFSNWRIVKRDKPIEVAAVKVTERAAAGQETEPAAGDVQVPRTEEARKLAYDVLGRINKSYNSLLSTDVAGFDAVYAVEKGGQAVGNLKLSWNRRMEGPLATLEGATDDKLKKKVDGFGPPILAALTGSGLGGRGSFYAVKAGGEFILDFTEEACKKEPDLQAMIAFVPEDLSQIRTLMFSKKGFLMETVQRAQEVGGTRFVSTATVTARAGQRVLETQEFTYTYRREEGLPFVSKLEEQNTVVNAVENWTLVLKNVAFQRGALPAELEQEKAREELEEAETELERILQKALQEKRDLWLGDDRNKPE